LLTHVPAREVKTSRVHISSLDHHKALPLSLTSAVQYGLHFPSPKYTVRREPELIPDQQVPVAIMQTARDVPSMVML